MQYEIRNTIYEKTSEMSLRFIHPDHPQIAAAVRISVKRSGIIPENYSTEPAVIRWMQWIPRICMG